MTHVLASGVHNSTNECLYDLTIRIRPFGLSVKYDAAELDIGTITLLADIT